MNVVDPSYGILIKYTKALSIALGYRDLSTRLHSDRVTGLAEALGICYGLSSKELGILKIAAAFHDVGKIGIPDSILYKPGRLDEAEWKIVKQHSEMGSKILEATELEGSDLIAKIVRHHHEQFNGKGYPDGLSGDAIPIGSRIISITDNYDAMAVTRSYHRSRTHSEILDVMLKEIGEKHDPELMHHFCDMIENSPFKAATE